MKKIYISGAISKDQDFKEKFSSAERRLIALGFDVVNPATLPHDHDKSWKSYMCEDLKALLDCDILIKLHDWNNSP